MSSNGAYQCEICRKLHKSSNSLCSNCVEFNQYGQDIWHGKIKGRSLWGVARAKAAKALGL